MIARKDIVVVTSDLLALGRPKTLLLDKIAEKAGWTIELINHWFSSNFTYQLICYTIIVFNYLLSRRLRCQKLLTR